MPESWEPSRSANVEPAMSVAQEQEPRDARYSGGVVLIRPRPCLGSKPEQKIISSFTIMIACMYTSTSCAGCPGVEERPSF